MGLFGYAALGIYTATFDTVSLRRKIGPEIHHIDQWLLIKRMEEVAAEGGGESPTRLHATGSWVRE